MTPDELLERVGAALRTQVAPATSGAIPNSQAFKAASILDKLSRQLRLEPAHRGEDELDRGHLSERLAGLLAAAHGRAVPSAVGAAVSSLAGGDYRRALCSIVGSLYACRAELGELFEPMLAAVRTALRAEIDRRMEFAR